MTAGTLFALAAALTLLQCTEAGALAGRVIVKNSLETDAGSEAAYPDYEYQKPMPKRAALLLDRLLVALQKAVENDDVGRDGYKPYVSSSSDFSGASKQTKELSDEKTMDLQRRGQAKGRVYWRCYFNAVSCFKRK